MKNIFDILRQKEADLQQLEREVEALRLAAKLLAGEDHSAEPAIQALPSDKATPQPRSGSTVARPAPLVQTRPEPKPIFKDTGMGGFLMRQFP